MSALVARFRRSGVFHLPPYSTAARPACRCACRSSASSLTAVNAGVDVARRPDADQSARSVRRGAPVYQRYQTAATPAAAWNLDNREQYAHFLLQSHCGTRLVEPRSHGSLRMVSAIDRLTAGVEGIRNYRP